MIRTFQSLALFIMCLELSGCGFFRAIGRGGLAVFNFVITTSVVLLVVAFVLCIALYSFFGWLMTTIGHGADAISKWPEKPTTERQLDESVLIVCGALSVVFVMVIGVINHESKKATAKSAQHAVSVSPPIVTGRSFSPMTWHVSIKQDGNDAKIEFDFRQANGESRRPTVGVYCTAKGTGRFLAEQMTIHIPAGSQMPMMFNHPFEPHWNPSSTSRNVDIYCDAFGYQRFIKQRI